MLSVFGYDATPPPTKNTDILFQLGYISSPEMGQAVLGKEAHFDQAARKGTIVTGGRAGANAPPYISDVSVCQIHRPVDLLLPFMFVNFANIFCTASERDTAKGTC